MDNIKLKQKAEKKHINVTIDSKLYVELKSKQSKFMINWSAIINDYLWLVVADMDKQIKKGGNK